jgi:hypothetical protein
MQGHELDTRALWDEELQELQVVDVPAQVRQE